MLVENLIDAAEHLTGFVIVMGTLATLWGVTALLGRLLGGKDARPVPAGVAAADPAPAETTDADEMVVIAATVAMMLDSRHRIISIRPRTSSWGQQGRREIHASHRIR